MTRVEELKAAHTVELKIAQLEDDLVTLKEKPGDGKKLRDVKNELREWRCVLRLGRPAQDGSHRGFNIVDGQLVEKEA